MSTPTLSALPTLSLPAELTIYTASETRDVWLAWLAAENNAVDDNPGDGRCAVHASAVDQVDAAGVQLLVALSHTLARQHRRLQLLDPSATLRGACEALGATTLLADGEQHGAQHGVSGQAPGTAADTETDDATGAGA